MPVIQSIVVWYSRPFLRIIIMIYHNETPGLTQDCSSNLCVNFQVDSVSHSSSLLWEEMTKPNLCFLANGCLLGQRSLRLRHLTVNHCSSLWRNCLNQGRRWNNESLICWKINKEISSEAESRRTASGVRVALNKLQTHNTSKPGSRVFRSWILFLSVNVMYYGARGVGDLARVNVRKANCLL